MGFPHHSDVTVTSVERPSLTGATKLECREDLGGWRVITRNRSIGQRCPRRSHAPSSTPPLLTSDTTIVLDQSPETVTVRPRSSFRVYRSLPRVCAHVCVGLCSWVPRAAPHNRDPHQDTHLDRPTALCGHNLFSTSNSAVSRSLRNWRKAACILSGLAFFPPSLTFLSPVHIAVFPRFISMYLLRGIPRYAYGSFLNHWPLEEHASFPVWGRQERGGVLGTTFQAPGRSTGRSGEKQKQGEHRVSAVVQGEGRGGGDGKPVGSTLRLGWSQ